MDFDVQTRDVSYGRKPDGSGKWLFFPGPTPGRAELDNGFPNLYGSKRPPVLCQEQGAGLGCYGACSIPDHNYCRTLYQHHKAQAGTGKAAIQGKPPAPDDRFFTAGLSCCGRPNRQPALLQPPVLRNMGYRVPGGTNGTRGNKKQG